MDATCAIVELEESMNVNDGTHNAPPPYDEYEHQRFLASDSPIPGFGEPRDPRPVAPKKPFYKRPIFWVLLVTALVLVACGAAVVAGTAAVNDASKLPTGGTGRTNTSAPAKDAGPLNTTIAGDGMYLVGRDFKAGTYSTTGPGDASFPCVWERLSGTTGAPDDTIAADISNGPVTVTVKATDVAFKTTNCAGWAINK